MAKSLSQLPYRFSKIKRTDHRYTSNNPEFNDILDVQFMIGKAISKKTPLEIWLTERYTLFQDTKTSINEFEIHHMEWSFNEIGLNKFELDYPQFNQLIKNQVQSMQYSKGIKVIAWGKHVKTKMDYA